MLYFFSLLIVGSVSFAQAIIDTAQTLPYIHREEIETTYFRVIYPSSLFKQAQLVANALESSIPELSQSLSFNTPSKKIDVILQNQSVISNGYVALAPFRSEWESVATLSHSLGNTNWFITLAIHEQRHMHQFLKYKKGFSDIMYKLFGEQGSAASIFLSTPSWYFEGDAVVEETLLTKSGRGRNANFLMHYRALLNEGKLPDYNKAFYGSYDSFIPNQYPLGYLLNLNLRSKYQKGSLNTIVDNTARKSFNPYAFERSVKNTVWKDIDSFFKESFEAYKLVMPIGDQSYQGITDQSKFYTNESYPFIFKDKVVYFKKGFTEPGAFFSFDFKTKKERKLFSTNGFNPHRLSKVDNYFVYSDTDFHPRYGLVSYANLYRYDFLKDEHKQLTKSSQLFYPQLREKRIAAIGLQDNKMQRIVILNLNGEEVKSFDLEDFFTAKSLTWKDKKTLLFAGVNLEGFSIIKSLDLESGEQKQVYSQDHFIADIFFFKNRIYFTSDITGVENLYSLSNSKPIRLTDAKYGLRSFSIDNESILVSSYSQLGYKISRVDTIKSEFQVKEYKHQIDRRTNAKDSSIEANQSIVDISSKNYQKKEHDKKSFRWHSWSYLTSLISPSLGSAFITSKDNLNELLVTTGVNTSFSEKAFSYFLNVNYQKYWPILHFKGLTGKRNEVYTDEEKDLLGISDASWNEDSVSLGFSLPFNFFNKGYSYSLSSTHLGLYKNISNKLINIDENNGELLGSEHSVSFSTSKNKAFYHFLPKYAFSISGKFKEVNTTAGEKNNAYLKSLSSRIILPGGFESGALYFDLGVQEKSNDSYRFDNVLRFSRGYGTQHFDNHSLFALNYAFTSFIPDFSFIFDLGFLRRIRTNFFYDRSRVSFKADIDSYGVENTFDLAPLRFANAEISIGMRNSYLKEFQEWDNAIFINAVGGGF